MGITYHTPNRQRRKVMTAPLSAPPEGLPEGQGAVNAATGRMPGWRVTLWVLAVAAAVAVAGGVHLAS